MLNKLLVKTGFKTEEEVKIEFYEYILENIPKDYNGSILINHDIFKDENLVPFKPLNREDIHLRHGQSMVLTQKHILNELEFDNYEIINFEARTSLYTKESLSYQFCYYVFDLVSENNAHISNDYIVNIHDFILYVQNNYTNANIVLNVSLNFFNEYDMYYGKLLDLASKGITVNVARGNSNLTHQICTILKMNELNFHDLSDDDIIRFFCVSTRDTGLETKYPLNDIIQKIIINEEVIENHPYMKPLYKHVKIMKEQLIEEYEERILSNTMYHKIMDKFDQLTNEENIKNIYENFRFCNSIDVIQSGSENMNFFFNDNTLDIIKEENIELYNKIVDSLKYFIKNCSYPTTQNEGLFELSKLSYELKELNINLEFHSKCDYIETSRCEKLDISIPGCFVNHNLNKDVSNLATSGSTRVYSAICCLKTK